MHLLIEGGCGTTGDGVGKIEDVTNPLPEPPEPPDPSSPARN